LHLHTLIRAYTYTYAYMHTHTSIHTVIHTNTNPSGTLRPRAKRHFYLIHHLLCYLQDYLIAEGYNSPVYSNGSIIFDAKYYYSQDGVRWVDLVAVDDETKSKAAKIKATLSGDPAKVRNKLGWPFSMVENIGA